MNAIASELSYLVSLKQQAERDERDGRDVPKVTAPVERSATPATREQVGGRSGIQLSNVWFGYLEGPAKRKGAR